MTLEQRAYEFAKWAHEKVGQKRKYTGEPYIVHPVAVAEMVREIGGSEQMIAAAYLHDVVEDTGVPLRDIRAEFGPEVAELVGWLTDVSKPEDGNRATRKALDRGHIAKAPPEAKTIKLADLIDNSASITAHDPAFAKRYLQEKMALLEVLEAGNARLWVRAKKIVDAYYASVA
jgi:(p)ppGpp synthase/HD superfamily hydrolase